MVKIINIKKKINIILKYIIFLILKFKIMGKIIEISISKIRKIIAIK